MAYLTKEQYEYRANAAAQRMNSQRVIDTLTQDQHDVLAFLCSIRHKIHSCDTSVIYNSEASEHNEYTSYLDTSCENKLSEMLEEVGLPPIKWYCDFDNVTTDLDEAWEEFESDEDRDEFRADAELEIAQIIQDWNTVIEHYLKEIDIIHGTSYCPTGALRKC